MIRVFTVAAAVVLGAGVVAAQDANQGRTVMKANGKVMGAVLSPMVKGEKPYDQAAVNDALAQLEETVKKLPTLYPVSLKNAKPDGDYSPSPKIWDNKAEFDAHIANFGKAVNEAKAKIKNLDTLKENLPVIGKQCSGCHETFRIKNS